MRVSGPLSSRCRDCLDCIWTLLIVVSLLSLLAAVIVAVKGRWGWLAAGALIFPLWLVGATRPAVPGSVWVRRRRPAEVR